MWPCLFIARPAVNLQQSWRCHCKILLSPSSEGGLFRPNWCWIICRRNSGSSFRWNRQMKLGAERRACAHWTRSLNCLHIGSATWTWHASKNACIRLSINSWFRICWMREKGWYLIPLWNSQILRHSLIQLNWMLNSGNSLKFPGTAARDRSCLALARPCVSDMSTDVWHCCDSSQPRDGLPPRLLRNRLLNFIPRFLTSFFFCTESKWVNLIISSC